MTKNEIEFLLKSGYTLVEIMNMETEPEQKEEPEQMEEPEQKEEPEQNEEPEQKEESEEVKKLKEELEKTKKDLQAANRKNAVIESMKEKTMDEILFKLWEDFK